MAQAMLTERTQVVDDHVDVRPIGLGEPRHHRSERLKIMLKHLCLAGALKDYLKALFNTRDEQSPGVRVEAHRRHRWTRE